MVEADRDREMVDTIVKKIEAEERAEQEQYLKSRYVIWAKCRVDNDLR